MRCGGFFLSCKQDNWLAYCAGFWTVYWLVTFYQIIARRFNVLLEAYRSNWWQNFFFIVLQTKMLHVRYKWRGRAKEMVIKKLFSLTFKKTHVTTAVNLCMCYWNSLYVYTALKSLTISIMSEGDLRFTLREVCFQFYCLPSFKTVLSTFFLSHLFICHRGQAIFVFPIRPIQYKWVFVKAFK